MSKAIPNTTQVPNVILDEWLPRLRDTELRVLLIIVRQTFGWIEDRETGRRKEKDWISRRQLMTKAGRGKDALCKAINTLVEYNLIEAFDEGGTKLVTSLDREKNGGRIYYRFNTIKPPVTLFDTLRESRRVGEKTEVIHNPSGFQGGLKPDPTKETHFTKYINNGVENSKSVDNQQIQGENAVTPKVENMRKPDKPDKQNGKPEDVERQLRVNRALDEIRVQLKEKLSMQSACPFVARQPQASPSHGGLAGS